MTKFLPPLLAAFVLGLAPIALGQEKDGQAVLYNINRIRKRALKEAEDAKREPDYSVIQKDVAAFARKETEGITGDKVPEADVYVWAQVFHAAERYDEVLKVTPKCLEKGLEGMEFAHSQYMHMDSLVNSGAAAKVAPFIREMKILAEDDFLSVAGYVYRNMPLTVGKKEPEALLAALDAAAERFKGLSNASIRGAGLRETATAKADLLISLGRKKEAVEVLTEVAARPDVEKDQVQRLKNKAIHLTLMGAAAPELPSNDVIHGFKGISSLKGKVVLLDFFGHWCPPCMAAQPFLHKAHKELADKGLVIVGVTQYFGFYGEEKGLTNAQERVKLNSFVKETETSWPVTVVGQDTIDAFGASNLPTIVVIDKKGVVREIKVSFNPVYYGKLIDMLKGYLNE